MSASSPVYHYVYVHIVVVPLSCLIDCHRFLFLDFLFLFHSNLPVSLQVGVVGLLHGFLLSAVYFLAVLVPSMVLVLQSSESLEKVLAVSYFDGTLLLFLHVRTLYDLGPT